MSNPISFQAPEWLIALKQIGAFISSGRTYRKRFPVCIVKNVRSAFIAVKANTRRISPRALEYRLAFVMEAVCAKVWPWLSVLTIRIGRIYENMGSKIFKRILFGYLLPIFLFHQFCFQFLYDFRLVRNLFEERRILLLEGKDDVLKLDDILSRGCFFDYIESVFDERRRFLGR